MDNGPFGSRCVIEEKISDSTVRAYLVGFDLKDDGSSQYRWKEFVQRVLSVIHEFSFGYHEGTSTSNTETLDKVVEAANAIYKIDEFQKVKDIYNNGGFIEDDVADKYLRRGEFGELILHLLLRDNFETVPLLSKIYFKDSLGHTVHGFDSVHIQPETESLWLGESKLYLDPKKGLTELVKDIKEHIKLDYLNSEFSLISKKIIHFEENNEIKKWKTALSSTTKLKDKLKNINIPLLCTYSSELFTKYDDEELDEFLSEYKNEIINLKEYFDKKNDHPLKDNINIILILFPVKCKIELVKRLHNKLSIIQMIGD
ncbi:hypothetical protein GCE9029_01438 [Grimontia celer]|uniref:Anti-bacteriophage protein A/HamA C-terminal domain-containing protein n=1 Tax=Grimontia celer TaxID=1796497 RepID=A0A128EXV3_9GAMM|nr:DUF1837 domain-containing protein [Grimontia celer]CZF79399.1 hypothetical protein GCE9029_01438 [Grimontia celer]